MRDGYTRLGKSAHWVILLLCILQFPTAKAIQRTHMGHPFGIKPSDLDLFLHQVHLYSGWIVGGLAFLLLIQRIRRRAPLLPDGMRRWQRATAHTGHLLLYACLAALVVTGTVTSYFSGSFAAPHRILTKIGMVLVGVHVVAAAWHQFVRRDALMWRMVPLLGRRPPRPPLS